MNLDGITAVITGGASGLGEATGRLLAEHGAKVGIFDLNEEKGEALAKELGGAFARVDVTSDEDVDKGFEKIRAALGQERILVNCAGIGLAMKTASRSKKTGEIRHHPLDAFAKIVDVNLVGTFRCIAKSTAGMLTLDLLGEERGIIVNTASVAAEDGQMGQAAYASSKAGVVGLTLPLARDFARERIRVNTILPGIFRTPLLELGEAESEKVVKALEAMIPNPSRLGNPMEFASLALEMCRNAYINGEDVRLDGAIRMSAR